MGNCCDGGEIKNVLAMRITGGILVAMGIVEIGVSASVAFGWWAPLTMIITGILGLASSNKSVVMTGLAFSIITLILMCIVSALAAASYDYYNQMNACVTQVSKQPLGPSVNTLTTMGATFYGDSTYYSSASTCEWEYYNSNACFCSSASGTTTFCYSFNMVNNYNCGDVFGTFTANLRATYIIAALCLIPTLFYSILVCVSACNQAPAQSAGPTIINVNPISEPILVQGSYASSPPVAKVYVN